MKFIVEVDTDNVKLGTEALLYNIESASVSVLSVEPYQKITEDEFEIWWEYVGKEEIYRDIGEFDEHLGKKIAKLFYNKFRG